MALDKCSPLGQERKILTVLHGQERCSLWLLEGVEPRPLQEALAARFGLGTTPFYLVQGSRSSAGGSYTNEEVVPLSAALPDHLTLEVRIYRESFSCSDLVADEAIFPHNVQIPPIVDQTQIHELSHPLNPLLGCQTNMETRGRPQYLAPLQHPLTTPVTPHDLHGLATPLLEAALEECDIRKGHPNSSALPRRQRSSSFEGSEPRSQNHESVIAEIQHAGEEMEKAVEAVDRLSRLSLDLANERTMLAWQRTCLAAIRTGLVLLGWKIQNPVWSLTEFVATLAMTGMVLMAAIFGPRRYSQIKRILEAPQPSKQFGRLSNKWIYAMVVSAAVASALGILDSAFRAEDKEITFR